MIDVTVEPINDPTLIPTRLQEQEPHNADSSQQLVDETAVTATWDPSIDEFIEEVRHLLFDPDSEEDNDDTNTNAPRINSNDDIGTDAEDDEVTEPIFNHSEINTFRYNLRPSKYGLRRSMTVEQVADACVALEIHDDIDGCWRLLEKLSPDKDEQSEALAAAYHRHWAKEEAASNFEI